MNGQPKLMNFSRMRDAFAPTFEQLSDHVFFSHELAIVHGNAYEEALKLRDAFVERLQPISSMVSPVSPCLAIHTGPGLLGAIVQEVL